MDAPSSMGLSSAMIYSTQSAEQSLKRWTRLRYYDLIIPPADDADPHASCQIRLPPMPRVMPRTYCTD